MKCSPHWIWLSFFFLHVTNRIFFQDTLLNTGIWKVLLLYCVNALATIPVFYWFYYRFYGSSDKMGVLVLQLEILIHFVITVLLLFYSSNEKEYFPVYNFLIFFIFFNFFKLAILMCKKKSK